MARCARNFGLPMVKWAYAAFAVSVVSIAVSALRRFLLELWIWGKCNQREPQRDVQILRTAALPFASQIYLDNLVSQP